MALKSTGTIKFSDVATELGISVTGLSLNHPGVRTLAGVPSGKISLGNLYGKSNIPQITISSNATDINLFTLAGSPGAAGKWQFIIASGVTVGQISSSAAVLFGAFPAGSQIELINNGSIQGRPGAANGGAGGDAIIANNATLIMSITNNGSILPGGGGGGNGGISGAGGTGGRGYYTASESRYNGSNYVADKYVGGDPCSGGSTLAGSWAYWDGVAVGLGGTYTRGSFYTMGSGQEYVGTDMCGSAIYQNYTIYYYYINASYNVITAGGAGGPARPGGVGGNGQGYGYANAAGAAGGAAVGGSPGGTNAGAGGASGTGGTGGTGGTWGQPGGAGASGTAGAQGGWGNNDGYGTYGTAGAAGNAGGAGGRYLVKGAATVTVTNNGTILGNVA